MRRDETPASPCLRPNVGERQRACSFLVVDYDFAIDPSSDHRNIPENLHRYVAGFVLDVLPRTVFEEGHVPRFVGELTVEANVQEIIRQQFTEGDVVPLAECFSEALLNLRYGVGCGLG